MKQCSSALAPQLRATDPPGPRRASGLELLTDLAFVVILSQLVERLLAAPSGEAVGTLLLLLAPVWWLWNGLTFYTNRFAAPSDLGDAPFVYGLLPGLLVLAAATKPALSSHPATVVFVLTYAGLRGLLQVQYARTAHYLPAARLYIRHVQLGFALGLGGWVGAVLAPAPLRYGLWALALAAELGTPLVARGRLLHQRFPPDARHFPERVATFITLVLGQLALTAVQGLCQAEFSGGSIGRTLLAGGILLGLWGAYFIRIYEAPVQALSEARRTGPFWAWLYLHLPLTCCLLLSSAGLKLAVAQRGAPALTSWLVGGGVGGSYLVTGLLGVINQWAARQSTSGARRRVASRLLAGACLLLAAPWGSALLLLLLAAAMGLGIVVAEYYASQPPTAGVPTIASRYARHIRT